MRIAAHLHLLRQPRLPEPTLAETGLPVVRDARALRALLDRIDEATRDLSVLRPAELLHA